MEFDSTDALRKAIRQIGVPDVAREAKIAVTTLYSFVDGKSQHMRGDTLQKVLAAMKRLGGNIIASQETFEAIPIYDIRAHAGAGALVEDGPPTGYQPYRASDLSRWRISELAVIQVGGDSMWETLHDGDKVLVNRGERRIVKPGIYILAYEGELLVKRCQRNLNDGSVIVSSDNPAYQSFKVDQPDQLEVIGRVIWIGRALG